MSNTAGETPRDGGTTTYGYLSLIRSCGGNEAWDDEDGELSMIAGKVPETYMPNVIVERDGEKEVIGVKYEREALCHLPERMKSEEAFQWAKENGPTQFRDFLNNEVSA